MSTTENEQTPATRKVAIKDMTPRTLDWLLAKLLHPDWLEEGWIVNTSYPDDDSGWVFQPTRHWEQGGQLLQQYGIQLFSTRHIAEDGTEGWKYQGSYLIPEDGRPTDDPAWRKNSVVITPMMDNALLAAMYALACVLMRTGYKAEVDVPEEVLNEN